MSTQIKHHSHYVIVGGVFLLLFSAFYAFLGAQLPEAKYISYGLMGAGFLAALLGLADYLWCQHKKKVNTPTAYLSLVGSIITFVASFFFLNMPVKEANSWNASLAFLAIILIILGLVSGGLSFFAILALRAEKAINEQFAQFKEETEEAKKKVDIKFDKDNVIEVDAIDVE